MGIEKPEYVVRARLAGIEFREYQPYWVAECEFANQSDLRAAAYLGFRNLFNYISGENDSAQKISMTAPVEQRPVGAGWAVSFVVPRSFYEGDIPSPTNSQLRLRKVPGGLVAALRFRGQWGSTEYEHQARKLTETLKSIGVTATGPATCAVYNPPLTPPILRRNEVLIPVEALPHEA